MRDHIKNAPVLSLQLLPVAGIQAHTICAGIRYSQRPDLVLFELAPDTQTAAMFTQNAFCAAPVQVAKAHLQQAMPRYWLINTGNANAGMGEQGLKDARECAQAVASYVGLPTNQVLPFSTGVIAERLPVSAITEAVPKLFEGLNANGWDQAANGILTTDTKPKGVSRQFEVDGILYTVSGIAKGAGMIKPNMATMLAFLATDCAVKHTVLQTILAQAVSGSFNRITIDGDTSTNDACVLAATGAAQNDVLSHCEGMLYQQLSQNLTEICHELALMLVRDGEGATKCVKVEVVEAKDEQEAAQVAYCIAESPLCKTAFFAADPNWGRVLAAVGRAGVVALEVDRVNIYLDDLPLAFSGAVASQYSEAAARTIMAQPEFKLRVELGRGQAQCQVWTTDLSYDYVRINADYRS